MSLSNTPVPSEDAIYAALNSRAVTETARDLITSLRMSIEVHDQITETAKYKRRGRKLQEFEEALGAFLADLLRAAGDKDAQGWVFRSMKTESFSHGPVSHATFDRIVRALTGVQYVEQVRGAPWWEKVEFDAEEVTYFNRGGTASRFRANSPLLNLGKSRGITPHNVDDHFLQELPRHPLVLKTASRTIRGRKIDSRPMRYTASPHTERLETDLKRL